MAFAISLAKKGKEKAFILPAENADEAAFIQNLEILPGQIATGCMRTSEYCVRWHRAETSYPAI